MDGSEEIGTLIDEEIGTLIDKEKESKLPFASLLH